MSKEIIADIDKERIRIGVLEDGQIVELYVEKSFDERVAGNIYKGKVANVLPGMQAAFIDIGLPKNAFLYIKDLKSCNNGSCNTILTEDIDKDVSIKDILHVGQKVMVQVVKEPIGTKGARVSTNITLPGRYLVFMPTVNYIGISRRIEDDDERQRLKVLADKIRPPNMGVIVRTVAKDKGEDELKSDMDYLKRLWARILAKQKGGKVPRIIYKDMDLLARIVRDIFTSEVDKFYVNTPSSYNQVREFVSLISPLLKDRVKLYSGEENIFEYFNIESEVEKALHRKVWLKSGGYIVIDHTEALTSIDVNTGKFVGSIDLEDTVVKTNIEAAREIARQLRLRDIGGIIIIDFIDMDCSEHEKMVMDVFEEELKKDKTKTQVLGMTNLGLVEMTRKKIRQSISEVLEKTCPYCDGKGKILSEETVAKKLEQKLAKIFRTRKGEAVLVEVHPSVASVIIGSGGNRLNQLEQKYKKYIFIKGRDRLHPEEIKIKAIGSKTKLQKLALPVKEGQIIHVTIEETHMANPSDGITRIDGYIIDIDKGANFVGSRVKIKIDKAFRTYAKATIV